MNIRMKNKRIKKKYGGVMTTLGRIRFFSKSGARLYIPQKVVKEPRFPFKDGELVKIEVGNNSLILRTVEWWEMLDWKTMPDAYAKLPDEIKEKIRQARLI
jgi:antitoxin component of MazEF toxin-antitoxin module